MTAALERLSQETIADALACVPSDEREIWVRMAMAVKSELGASGFDIWDRWSQSAANYNARDAKDVWRSVTPSGGVTIATLISEAQQRGFTFTGKHCEIDQAELDARKAKREAEQKAEAERKKAKQLKAAQRASDIFNSAKPDGADSHPYTLKKGVQIAGQARVGSFPVWDAANRQEVWIDNTLIIPIRDADRNITSLQAIFPNADNLLGRDRTYLPSGKKEGGYTNIGTPQGVDDPVILVCEGYATGETLHQATGHCVFVSFDAGNLEAVAKIARKRKAQARIIICADDDRYHTDPKKKNDGMRFATIAAKAVGGVVAYPNFTDRTDKPTDFNDLHIMQGIEEVAFQIQAVLDGKVSMPDQESKPVANDNFPAPVHHHGYDMEAVDWFSLFPHLNGKGKPLAIIENVREAIRRLGVTIRYNVISKEIEILIPGEGFSIDNQANASLAWIMSACVRFGLSTDKLGDYLCYLADQNQFNPVAQWITSKAWDGISRLPALYNTLRVEGEINPADDTPNESVLRLKEALIRRWLISAAAAAFNPNGVSAKGVLVLQGEQNLGKTSWFKRLVPSELGVIAEGLSLRPDDRDSVKQVLSFWLVELGELDATFRKADIAALKAFIGKDKDTLRRAYARLESNYARRTVFFASVNPRQFLHDPTGNTRYWTLACKSVNYKHTIDMQQLWAEVYQLYLSGESWHLTPEEAAMLNGHNADYEVLDPIRERILSRFNWQAKQSDWTWKTATDVMVELGYDKPNRADVTQCGHILQELNGGKTKRSNGKKLSLVPPKAYIQSDDNF